MGLAPHVGSGQVAIRCHGVLASRLQEAAQPVLRPARVQQETHPTAQIRRRNCRRRASALGCVAVLAAAKEAASRRRRRRRIKDKEAADKDDHLEDDKDDNVGEVESEHVGGGEGARHQVPGRVKQGRLVIGGRRRDLGCGRGQNHDDSEIRGRGYGRH